ncbi:MAG: ECF transporter S component [Nitrososphaerales archaeon]|nr:ECF transporter S component [Nitrososphaerales archaeon]
MNTREVASAAVFTAFVAAATMAFSLSIPVTSGYFNIGEIMVYTAALLMGPYVGAFAGGVGSMISDLSLGFPSYAPGTLIIKGIEGFVVGYLGTRVLVNLSRSAWRATSIGLAAVVGGLSSWLGLYYLNGSYQLTLGFPIGPQANFAFDVPSLFWVGLGIIAFAGILYVSFRANEKLGWTVLAVLVGGSEMVLGYFLYESVVLQLGFVSAAGEVPFNIAQAVVGLLVSVPLVRSIKKVSGRTGQAIR